MEEEKDDLVVLIDEDGEEIEFEHLDTIEMNGSEYVVLLPASADDEDQEIDEVVILKVDYLEDGEETYISIDDDKELNLVFDEFKKRMQEQYDFDD